MTGRNRTYSSTKRTNLGCPSAEAGWKGAQHEISERAAKRETDHS